MKKHRAAIVARVLTALGADRKPNRKRMPADMGPHRRGDAAHARSQDAPAVAQTLIARDHDARVDAASERDPPIRT